MEKPICRIDYPVHERTLDNGLRVVVNPDPTTPAVAVNLWYHVGSADEQVGAYGFAHLFEHLMFQGSPQVESGEHLAAIQSSGGSANATTSFDRTNYFETVPSNALELALWLEADRMSGLQITQHNLDTQREVVKEEKRQRYDNVPYGDMLDLLLSLNFSPDHPYGHTPIGSISDLDAASLTAVQDFHQAWYQPANATIVMSGDITENEAFPLVERYFGTISSVEKIVREPPSPPTTHTGVPRLNAEREVPRDVLHLCWLSPAFGTRTALASGQALSIAAEGQSSRLHRDLVREQGLAEAVGASDFALTRGTSLAIITLRPREGVPLEILEDAAIEHLDDLAAHGPTSAELDRSNAIFEREWLSSLSAVDSRADHLNEFTTLLGDPQRINTFMDEVHSITPDDVTEAFRSVLSSTNRAILAYHAKETR